MWRMKTYRRLASDISHDLLDRRNCTRRAISLPVTIVTGFGDTHAAIVQNVSSRGFNIQSEYGVTIGRFLSLDIPGLAQYPGWVAWSYLGGFGLEVANPIPEQVIEYIVAMAVRHAA